MEILELENTITKIFKNKKQKQWVSLASEWMRKSKEFMNLKTEQQTKKLIN